LNAQLILKIYKRTKSFESSMCAVPQMCVQIYIVSSLLQNKN